MPIWEKIRDSFFEEEPENPSTEENSVDVQRDLVTPSLSYDGNVPPKEVSPDIVSQAYGQFKDNQFDIFIVEELSSNFEGIPEDTKNTLIRKNLATLGVDLSLVIGEAKQRKAAISEVTQEHQSDSERLGQEISSQIADAKARIDELSARNIERENKMQAELAGAKAELERLDNIIYILGGEK